MSFIVMSFKIYESDEFFEIADEMGILIWQDFMFACALYPAHEAFLQTVTEEITHQVTYAKDSTSISQTVFKTLLM